MRQRALLAALLAAATVAGACGDSSSRGRPAVSPSTATTAPGDGVTAAEPEPGPSAPRPGPTTTASPTGPTDAELADLGANELGRVLILEWHDITDTDGRWENSLQTFREQIQELYDRGYRPVTAAEFAAGTFPIPAGTSPVVLTFDDSYRSHLWFGEDGEPHPDSVVGVLEAFSREHPDWRATATFFIYWPVPFRETDRDVIERKLRWLVEQGYELGNHTLTHDDLGSLTSEQVQQSLAGAQAELQEVVPGYEQRSLALTFGGWPQDRSLAFSGEWNGHTYEHDVVLKVGSMPTRSPHHAEFDREDVQRVQAWVPEFRTWVDWLDEDLGRRFVSDGDPSVVSYPTTFADVAAPRSGFDVRVYEGGA